MKTTAPSAGNLVALKEWNRDRVLELLREGGGLSQAELARRSGLSQGTISNVVASLVAERVVVTRDGVANGRRAKLVELAVARPHIAVGIDIARRHLSVAAVTSEGEVLSFHAEPRDPEIAYANEMRRCADAVDALLAELGLAREDVDGVGVGLCIGIGPLSRRVPSSAGLDGFSLNDTWAGASLADDLSRATGLRTIVTNDADCGALAETAWGSAAGSSNVVFVELGEGIGGGLIVDGTLHRGGAAGPAGELGHLSHDPAGSLCVCGNRGCLETVAGGRALLAQVGDLAGRDLTLERLADLAREGNRVCRRVVVDAARPIAVALWNAISVLAPDTVVLGGELARAGEVLSDAVRYALGGRGLSGIWHGDVLLGALAERAVAMGAALAVWKEDD